MTEEIKEVKPGRKKTIFNSKTIHIDSHVHSLIEDAKHKLKTKTFSETIEKVFASWKNPPLDPTLKTLGNIVKTMPKDCQKEFRIATNTIKKLYDQPMRDTKRVNDNVGKDSLYGLKD